MKNRELYINKKIINADKEEGVVTSFNENYITIKYLNTEKKYDPFIAFQNKYISFIDEKLNHLIEEEIKRNEEAKIEKEKKIAINRQNALIKIKKINEEHADLAYKNSVIQEMFGSDFRYPPYIEFMKNNKHLIRKERYITVELINARIYEPRDSW